MSSAMVLVALPELATQINQEHALCIQSYRSGLEHAHRAGDLLLQAKAQTTHGSWLPWLKDNCHIAERTAQSYMRIAREWPQLEKSATVAELSFRDALTLLSEPEDSGAVIDGELVQSPAKPASGAVIGQFKQGDRVQVTSPDNLFHGQEVQVTEKCGDIYLARNSKGQEYPFLPGELEPTEPQPEPEPKTIAPKPTVFSLKELLRRIYMECGGHLPSDLLYEIEVAIN